MKNSLTILFFSFGVISYQDYFTQNPEIIIRDAVNLAQKSDKGRIIMKEKVLILPENYISERKIEYLFIKNETSSIYPFNFCISYSDTLEWLKLIFKDDVHYYLKSDSDTMDVRRFENMGNKLKDFLEDMLVPLPYGQTTNNPLPTIKDLDSNFVSCELLGTEKIFDKNCYVIRVKEKTENSYFTYITKEKTLWIEKKTKLLWRFESDLHYILEGDTIRLFNETNFDLLELGRLKKESIDSSFNIPSKYIEETIFPKTKPSLLKPKSIAPEWIGQTIDGEKVKLSDFKGKIVLLDFFFRGCTGCMLVMPDVIATHKKHKDVIVISIDPVDDIKLYKDMKSWLKKKEMTQHVVFTDNKITKDYGVSAYPTYVLIDKNGQISWSLKGFEKNESMQDVFEREILKLLE